MKNAVSTSYSPPVDADGVVALMALDQWIEDGLKLEEGKYGLGFPFMYLLFTGTMGLKVHTRKPRDRRECFWSSRRKYETLAPCCSCA